MAQYILPFEGLLVQDAFGRIQSATAGQILEAARAVIERQLRRDVAFTDPHLVREFLCAKLATVPHEVFAVLFLDSQHRLIEYVELFRGTINAAAVYPREVVKEALARNAAAVILAHNHPSGVPEPSAADRQLTDRLRDTLQLVEVRVLDHFVVGGNQATSFAERGWL